jgi:hypothetical protein
MLTVADKVRSMNDEQLAKFMQKWYATGCLLIIKFPGTNLKWLAEHAGHMERSILKFLQQDESTKDWSWLNGKGEN